MEFELPFFGGHPSFSITSVLGITGYLIATVLGIWLIVSIFRSGPSLGAISKPPTALATNTTWGCAMGF
jgi:hypothetical protein